MQRGEGHVDKILPRCVAWGHAVRGKEEALPEGNDNSTGHAGEQPVVIRGLSVCVRDAMVLCVGKNRIERHDDYHSDEVPTHSLPTKVITLFVKQKNNNFFFLSLPIGKN